jgi:formylglycine-generating enzyme required for sulfatase activity
VTIQRALLLSLGPEEFEGEPGGVSPRSPLTREGKEMLVKQLREMYRTAADPGLQAAAEWLLGQWQEEAWLAQTDKAWARDKKWRENRQAEVKDALRKEKAKPQWYVTGQGQKMVVIPGPVEFVMGSPPAEADRRPNELQHRKRIGRSFALAATPVTVKQFRRFLPTFSHNEMGRYPDLTCPIGGVLWYEAARYCNWLSEREDIPKDQWCYEMDPKGQVVKLQEKYLSLTGYRLPTEAEMEYATRAGALTSRYYGETAELLGKYAWYSSNAQERTWPVGSKKPNDLGLFDLHGNVYSWCQELYRVYPQAKADESIEDKEDILDIDRVSVRVLRGGSFNEPASNVRSAYRFAFAPTDRFSFVGFRPARTFAP